MALQLRSPVTQPLHEFGWPRPSSGTQADDFRITSPFGWRDDPLNPGHRVFHGGLDIGNGRLGYPEVAVADGVVVDAGFLLEPWSQKAPANHPEWVGGNYGGNMVVVRHEGGVIALYAHMAARQVNAGQRVTSGQQLGTLGDTGSARGQGHLHFGLQYQGQWIDPEPYVRLGRPLEIEDDAMPSFPAGAFSHVTNRDCEIRSGTNIRNNPDLAPASILWTTERNEGFRPTAKINGAEANGSRVWYVGWLYDPKRGYTESFVHGSRCTPLVPVEKVSDPSLQQRITQKDDALKTIKRKAEDAINV